MSVVTFVEWSVTEPLRIATIAASNRAASWNRVLLARVIESIGRIDPSVVIDEIDLRAFPLPLYDGDLQDRDGIPHAAQVIHDRVKEADGVVFAIPEYNGGYPALFKNTIDWVSRLDMLLFQPRYVGLISATPGGGGGARGLVHTKALFDNIFVTTHEDHLPLPAAHHALGADASPEELDARIDAWVTSYLAGVRAHRAVQAAA